MLTELSHVNFCLQRISCQLEANDIKQQVMVSGDQFGLYLYEWLTKSDDRGG